MPRFACLVLGASVLATSCGSLNFFHRRPDSVINVRGDIFGVSRDAACELRLLKTNGRPVETVAIRPAFDRSVVIQPASAKRVFEVSCAGQPGTFRSRAYKSDGLLEVDLGTIHLTSLGDGYAARRR